MDELREPVKCPDDAGYLIALSAWTTLTGGFIAAAVWVSSWAVMWVSAWTWVCAITCAFITGRAYETWTGECDECTGAEPRP